MSKLLTNDKFISVAHPHSIKKFELVASYVETWAQKLMNYDNCHKLVYIDCMCNKGEYKSEKGKQVFGTPYKVSKILIDVAKTYSKEIIVYFNDIEQRNLFHLKGMVDALGPLPTNIKFNYSVKDANELLYNISGKITKDPYCHCLLFYDPFEATIDWQALEPFFNSWSEVIINHMVMDSNRAVSVAKKEKTIAKYEQTYIMPIDKLITFNGDKSKFEKRVEEIIEHLHISNRKFYIASFPFFNSRNGLLFNLIFYTQNIKGFKLIKKMAWKIFGGKYSSKRMAREEILDFDGGGVKPPESNDNYYDIFDIADFLNRRFHGQKDIPLDFLWEQLDEHPIFPSEGFKPEIKNVLKDYYGAKINKVDGETKITFKE